MTRILPVVIASLLLLAGCGTPTLTPEQSMALRQAQTRQFEVPYNTVWAATIGYLQDNYYDIGQANKDGMILTASKVKAKKDPSGELMWAHIKKGDFIALTLSFDAIDDQNTKVRVNVNTTRDEGAIGIPMGFGMTYTKAGKKVTPITDPVVYQGFLDNLNREVQRRWMAQKMREDGRGR